MADNIDAQGMSSAGNAATSMLSPSPTASGGNNPDTEGNRYKMTHRRRGEAVIINNKDFLNKECEERIGTDLDAKSMYDLLVELGFESIANKQNLTAQGMKDCLKKASQEDYTNMDCFVCVVLSHGGEGFVWGTDEKVDIEKLVLPFKGDICPSLAGKPKIFFIQACRGTQYDGGVTVSDAAGSENKEEPATVYRIPVEADFLMAYSTVPGFLSWRNSNNGSWFIQAVFDILMKNWKQMDLLSMMTLVNRKVAYHFESQTSNEKSNKKKQIPCITSMLTKDVYF